MPIHLQTRDLSSELADARSVLIVTCPVCPQVSLAMQTASPWLELGRRGLKTAALEAHIRDLRDGLAERGVRTGVFTTRFPLPTMCLWTRGQRDRMQSRAEGHDTVVVMGCDSATHTAREALQGTQCRVVQGMEWVGISNAIVSYRFPLTFELREATRVEAPTRGEA